MSLRFKIDASLLFLAFVCVSQAAEPDLGQPTTNIVIGFVGGMVRHTNAIHSEVQLATRLLNDYPRGLQVRMLENRRGSEARREILELLDANHDGRLSDAEKSAARIVIYGHSWGASETVTLARKLGQEGIPVLLTIQVDSVAKLGENDRSIPANVAQAINFYQRDGLLRGEPQIHAEDSSRTRILGNFRFAYQNRQVDCTGYPWYAQMFMKPHIEIESDPNVWDQVESLIRSKLPAASGAKPSRNAGADRERIQVPPGS